MREKTAELKDAKERNLVKFKADQKERASKKKHRQEMLKKSVDEKRRNKSHMRAMEARANATTMLNNQSIQASALSHHRTRFPMMHGMMPGAMMTGGMMHGGMMHGGMHGMMMHGGGNMNYGNMIDTAMIPSNTMNHNMNNNMMATMNDAAMVSGSAANRTDDSSAYVTQQKINKDLTLPMLLIMI